MRTPKAAILLLLCGPAAAEELFFENFESDPTTSFVLNTAENGSQTDATSANKWVINNTYAGGSGSLVCFGFPFSYSLSSTPAQPMAITNAPNSQYLHTLSDEAEIDGILNANFTPADGTCFFDTYSFARMTSDLDTRDRGSVTLRFWWIGGGNPDSVYLELYYSTDSGMNWLPITVPQARYSGATDWAQQSITLDAWRERATLRFGFRFVNTTTSTVSEPGFGIDDVRIEALRDVLFTNGFEPAAPGP